MLARLRATRPEATLSVEASVSHAPEPDCKGDNGLPRHSIIEVAKLAASRHFACGVSE